MGAQRRRPTGAASATVPRSSPVVIGYAERKIRGEMAQTDREGHFVHPTALTNVNPGMRLYREEIFGPVVSIMPFGDEDEAIAMANDTDYGLAGTVWTTNISRGHGLVKRLVAGNVQINCQLIFDHDVPFGGHEQSGWGHAFGKEGIEGYLNTKSVWAQL
jgi:acyl-CoA reductase-like NAD-dependent aldehyde dehydrogenase